MEHPIWGPDEGVMPPRKYLSGLPVLPVRDRNFRWLAEESVVLRENELLVLPIRDRNFWWGPELPVEPDRKFR
jgi:hypothetical protein